MNKKILLAGALAALTLSGCQSLEDQIGSKIAEGIINTASNGEVKVKFDDLEKGKFNIETKEGTISVDGDEKGGTFKMTDETGKTLVEGSGADGSVVVKDENGKEILNADDNSMTVTDKEGNTSSFSGGEGRPADAPSDMPSPNGANDFSFFNSESIVSLNYKVPDTELLKTCDEVRDMIEGSGWSKNTSGFNSESDDNIIRSFENSGYTLMESCSLTDSVPTISLQKMKKKE
jgi:hypothetical protein